MPHYCVAFGCYNNGKEEGISFHCFPKNEDLKQKWINAVKRKDWQPTKWSKLCSAHFRERDIDRTSKLCVRIRKGAVPGIFRFRKSPSEPTCEIFNCATQYKDLLENNARKKSDHIDVAACHNPWEHDHGLYPKQSRSHPDEISEAGQDAGPVHSPESRVTVTGSDLCSDTDEAHSQPLWQRLQGSSQSCPADIRHAEGGARKRDRSTMDDSESERGCSRKRPGADGHHLEHLPRPDWLHSEHPYLDEPVDVNDMLDIKEEPFPEEELPMENIHTEENIEQRQNMCTTLLNTDCYGTVKIKQEKEEYPITVKYEMDHPFPDEPVDVNDMLDIKEEPFPEEELPMENIHTEENIEQRQNMCTTLLNTDCYGTVKIKQEKEEYPITVKYEMVDTWLVTETGVQ